MSKRTLSDDLITRLNELVCDMNSAEIESHIKNGTLSDWLLAWKMEMGVTSASLYDALKGYEDRLEGDGLSWRK